MKKNNFIFLTSVLVFLSVASFSYAQMGMMWGGSDGWGRGGAYCGMYNTTTIETISGEVINIDKFAPYKGMSQGVRITVKTDKETVSVHLGPLWYLEKQDFKLEAKDKITVKGSVINFNGQKAIMATEVKKGDSTLRLWDDRGYPLWSGCCGW
jgi:hypothetical protein